MQTLSIDYHFDLLLGWFMVSVSGGCPKTTDLTQVTAARWGEAVRNTPPVVIETSFALLFGQPENALIFTG
jgi:hypothetical protein